MPMQVWKQTASDKDKSAVAGEIAIITILGLNPETNERQVCPLGIRLFGKSSYFVTVIKSRASFTQLETMHMDFLL